MNNILKTYLLLVILAGGVSCSSVKKIRKNMNSSSYSMAYLMDSQISNVKKEINVFVDTVYFNSDIMADSTKIIRNKGWFLPLVFVYVWNSQITCVQGKSMIEEEMPLFFRKSMIDEMKRSGEFHSDTLNEADYTIELSIDEIKTVGPYVSKGFFYTFLYAYGYAYSDYAGPAMSDLNVSYSLKKGNQVVYHNSFHSERKTEQINKKYVNNADLQHDYSISMVEATSYNFKNVAELITEDLNSYFNKQNTKLPTAINGEL